jgi:polar amino acid transport system substrate-binding protein
MMDQIFIHRPRRDWSLALGTGLALGRAVAARLVLWLILPTALVLLSCKPAEVPRDGGPVQTRGGTVPAAGPAGGEERPGAGWRALNDLAQGRIGVIMGTLHAAYAERTYPRARVTAFNTTTDLIMALEGGKVDTALVDAISGQVVLQTHQDLGVLDDGFFVYPLGIGFRRDRAALRVRFDRFLERVRGDGRYAEMHRRWFAEDPERAQMPERRAKSPGERYVLGVAVADLPYVAYQDGRYVGFDIEVLEQFAADEGIDLEIRSLDFGALIPALVAGKVDLIADGIAITEERRKAVDFSAPYGEGRAIALALKSRLAATATPPGEPDTRDALPQPTTQAGWRRLEDLAEGRIAAFTGTATDLYATRTFPRARVLNFNSKADFVLALKTGKADVALTDAVDAQAIVLDNPELAVLDDDFLNTPIAAAFRPQDDDLRERFDRFLAAIRTDGTLEAIHRRWTAGDPAAAAMPAIPVPDTDPDTDKPLRIGTSLLVGPPYVFLAGQELAGYDVELIRRFAAREGLPIEIVPLEFDALIAALAAGKIDMIVARLSDTEERRKRVDFSQPYDQERSAALVQRRNLATPIPAAAGQSPPGTGGWRSLDDLATDRIAVFAGTIQDRFLETHYPQAQVVHLTSQADLVTALKTGKVDAGLIVATNAREIQRVNPEIGILGEPLLPVSQAVAFRQQDTDLRARFDRFMALILADGTHQAMRQRWFGEDPNAAVMPEITLPAQGPTLHCGVSVLVGLPYVALVDGRYVGFDIELVRRFAAHEGLGLSIAPMEFSALIPALAAGKLDLVASALGVTEERQRQVAFSSPYAEVSSVVLALKRNLTADRETQPGPVPGSVPESAATVGTSPWLDALAESIHANFVLEGRWRLIVNGLWVTVLITVAATLFGTLLGGAVCWLRMSQQPALRFAGASYIFLIRGLPVLLLLMLIFYVAFASVDIDPLLVAVIAFGMNFAAYVSEMFRSGIEGVGRGQTEAGIAMGFTPFQTFRYIVLPQAGRRILPVYRGEFISLVKMTSIVGYIGVQDLTKAGDIIRSRTFEAFFPLLMIAAVYFLIIWALGLVLDHIDRRTDPRARRRARGAT